MAMMRLSTAASDGKANLHQGAVGVGLNMATGLPFEVFSLIGLVLLTRIPGTIWQV